MSFRFFLDFNAVERYNIVDKVPSQCTHAMYEIM